ncbi:MAG: diaminopimelate epimerase [Saprospiraceae bacterium]|nr:MAG: diaminopimelate epimerase [Saprospiraceae bacterium]
MSKLPFFKYQGTGNDFVLVDNREGRVSPKDNQLIRTLCDRKFGVGADGLILMQNKAGFDFEMVYFNSDGSGSTMCGNGGRCIVAFARYLNIIGDSCRFWAVGDAHDARINAQNWVELKMAGVERVEQGDGYFVLDTGSPHYVIFVEDIDDIHVVKSGQVIRYSDRFRKEGINVDFVEKTKDGLLVATYERGVENETLSCGTGVTAAAISSYFASGEPGHYDVPIKTKGGDLQVKFDAIGSGAFQDVWLCGPAVQVFSGTYFL